MSETLPPETEFLMRHGENITDRMTEELLQAIAEQINATQISYGGKMCRLKLLGKPRERDGEWMMMFDVLNPGDGFDHVEFTITKTGWGKGA